METLMSEQPQPSPTPRVDIYRAVHKGLRAFFADTLVRVGRTDPSDPEACARTAAEVTTLLELCEHHLADEEAFIHTVIEQRLPGAARRTADDHLGHVRAIAELRALATHLASAGPDRRSQIVGDLYADLASFVAENLEHMRREESENNAALWAAFSDRELEAVTASIVAHVPPHAMVHFQRWMLVALSHGERVAMLCGMRANAPAAAYEATLALARESIGSAEWGALERALRAA